jgi:hypothetical protein
VGEQGAGLKRGEDVRRWPEIARSWARPRRGIVGELTGGVGGAERERRACKRTAPTDLAHGAARERRREGALVGADKRGPPVRHQVRAGAGLCLVGRLGLN